MTESAAPEVQPEKIPQQPITARYSRYYRNMRYIMVLAILAGAGWFAYDGWSRWPEHNRKVKLVTEEIARLSGATSEEDRAKLSKLANEKKELGNEHSDLDIWGQKALAFGLPVLAAAYLVFFLRRSRGEYRLEQDTLHAPGHPPVTIESFKEIDGKRWRKKGIAYLHYEADGATARIRLDTFIYDQRPMDDMYEVIARRHGVWEATKPLPAGSKGK